MKNKKQKIPQRIWHGRWPSGRLTQAYLTNKKDVRYYEKRNGMEFVEYVLAKGKEEGR